MPRTHSPVSGLRQPQLPVLLGDAFHYGARGASDFVGPAKAALKFAQLRPEIGFECRSRADWANRRVISSAFKQCIHGQDCRSVHKCGPAQRPGNSRWADRKALLPKRKALATQDLARATTPCGRRWPRGTSKLTRTPSTEHAGKLFHPERLFGNVPRRALSLLAF